MKKFAIINLFLISLVSLNLFSQNRFKYGIKGGMQLTNMVDIHEESRSRLGFQGGFAAQYYLGESNSWALHGELIYLQHGENNNLPSSAGGKQKYYVDYIAMPIMLRYFLSPEDSAFFLEFGPQFAFEINNSVSNGYTTSSFPSLSQSFIDSLEDTRKFDFTLGAGLGFSISRKFDIGFRYNYGFIDLYHKFDSPKRNVSSNLSFALTYFFN